MERGSGDPEIRRALRAYLSSSDERGGSSVIEELGLCQGQIRADVVVVGDHLHAYEIKSDRDRLARLARQVEIYGMTMDRVTLVAGARQIAQALRLVPRWWGALRVDETADGLRFTQLRKGRSNGHGDRRALVELLWLPDALRLLDERGISRGLKGKPRCHVWDRICAEAGLEEVAPAVRQHLVGRLHLECSMRAQHGHVELCAGS